jgi:Ca2+-binding EF-hand superfamily protein
VKKQGKANPAPPAAPSAPHQANFDATQLDFSSYGPCEVDAYVERLFSIGDADDNGVLEKEEIMQLCSWSGFPFDLGTVDYIMSSCDANGDGVIDLSEFKTGIVKHMEQQTNKGKKAKMALKTPAGGKKLLDFTNYTPKQLDSYVTKLFAIGDLDKSGSLEQKEIHQLLNFSGFPFDLGKAEDVMKRCDTNRDGFIDLNEFRKMIGNAMQAKPAPKPNGAESAAPESDSSVDFSTYTPLQVEAYIQKLFEIGDTDKNGTLDRAEVSSLLSFSGFPFEVGSVEEMLELCDTNKDGFVDLNEFRQLVAEEMTSQASSKKNRASFAKIQTPFCPKPYTRKYQLLEAALAAEDTLTRLQRESNQTQTELTTELEMLKSDMPTIDEFLEKRKGGNELNFADYTPKQLSA